MDLAGEGYWLVRLLFQRGLAVVYLAAFVVAARQFRPLAGENGLLPLGEFAERAAFGERPSLFHLVPSDRAVGAAAWTGVALSVAAVVGVPYWLPEAYATPASMLLWLALWGLYLSFVNAGRVFYGYGWESMLLETGFLAVFLGAGASSPPVVVVWLVKWVLFRNMFGAGLIKVRGDDCWRNLTCMDYHYETQPMPNPGSWYAHHLPDRFHRVEVLGNHVVELAVPFLYFAPQPYAAVGGAATVLFQGWLMLTGNFAWLNALTVVQAVATFSDGVLARLAELAGLAGPAPAALPVSTPATVPTATPVYLQWLSVLLAAVVLALSVGPVRNVLSEAQAMNASYDPLSLVNAYGAFGSVTRDRYQLVIEGSRADDPAADDWTAYGFAGQPVRTDERPPQWTPYHLRLDWQLWFAAMRPRPGSRQRWLVTLLERLLEGDEATRSLLGDDPFGDDPPERVRVTRYRYRFTTPAERRETGDWWVRERVGTYVAPASLADLRSRRRGRRAAAF
ncbi:lipase maturation factor family protein [Candidatus Halobonum tyrrellensis]|uniref:Lipase maturation factor family protein n=1 Tax=Candidatus Halobonum tyrrellensis G22 TaxID=1324957 RepID=V4GQW0_9EURY|nr:lipase maturation factor family protein [Candidatus Halobonum tyrrellensis]ESP87436.1 hypothetical protein K933_14213 [Candidatus Halobonum tyrrellensis G22]